MKYCKYTNLCITTVSLFLALSELLFVCVCFVLTIFEAISICQLNANKSVQLFGYYCAAQRLFRCQSIPLVHHRHNVGT